MGGAHDAKCGKYLRVSSVSIALYHSCWDTPIVLLQMLLNKYHFNCELFVCLFHFFSFSPDLLRRYSILITVMILAANIQTYNGDDDQCSQDSYNHNDPLHDHICEAQPKDYYPPPQMHNDFSSSTVKFMIMPPPPPSNEWHPLIHEFVPHPHDDDCEVYPQKLQCIGWTDYQDSYDHDDRSLPSIACMIIMLRFILMTMISMMLTQKIAIHRRTDYQGSYDHCVGSLSSSTSMIIILMLMTMIIMVLTQKSAMHWTVPVYLFCNCNALLLPKL